MAEEKKPEVVAKPNTCKKDFSIEWSRQGVDANDKEFITAEGLYNVLSQHFSGTVFIVKDLHEANTKPSPKPGAPGAPPTPGAPPPSHG